MEASWAEAPPLREAVFALVLGIWNQFYVIKCVEMKSYQSVLTLGMIVIYN